MQIYNKTLESEKLKILVDLVKRKKELMYLDNSYARLEIKRFLIKYPKIIPIINTLSKMDKNKDVKLLVKEVRERLHLVYGMFQASNIKKREKLLNSLKSWNDQEIEQLLKTHISTRERVKINKKLYDQIFSITGLPESVLDLGCGLNPLTLPFMGLKKVSYIASDFNELDMKFLDKYFSLLPTEFNGLAVKIDLLQDIKKLSTYSVDICFLFKVLDTLEGMHKNISYDVIKNIKAKNIVVSFPLKSLSGKRDMFLKKRNWFEKVCDRTGWKFVTFDMADELFYVLSQ